jgi:transcription initiation factor TFIID TATA-box-binding protein
MSEMGVIDEPEDEWFSIQNYVCTGEIGTAQNLNALAIGLGLENTEYEPEQFPGLIYRPESHDCVVLSCSHWSKGFAHRKSCVR